MVLRALSTRSSGAGSRPTRRPPAARVAALAAAALALAALAAQALARAAVPACDAAYEEVQTERAAGRYTKARAALLFCARPECGPEPGSAGSIERDCAAWLEEDLLKTPTLVLGARDELGGDLRDVRVTMDGSTVALPLDGKPLEIDAGEHTLTFARRGVTVTRRVLARYGERGIPLVVTLRTGAARAPAAQATSAPTGTSPLRVAGLAAAAAGLVAIGVGTGFAVVAEAADRDAACDPSDLCELPERRRDAQRAGGVATVAFFAGAGLVLGGVVLALVAPPRRAAPVALRLGPLVGSHAGLALGGAF